MSLSLYQIKLIKKLLENEILNNRVNPEYKYILNYLRSLKERGKMEKIKKNLNRYKEIEGNILK